MMFNPEANPIIEAHEPADCSAIAATCDAIYLANADGVWIIVHEDYASDTTKLTMTLDEGETSAVAVAGTYAVTATWGGWKNITCQTSDAITALTAAATFELDGETAGNNCLWMFYFSAAKLTAGRDWLHPLFTGGDASNLASVLFILDRSRYKQAAPLTAVA